MERITHRTAGSARAPLACVHMAGGFAQGEAIERLAQYEDMCEELQAQQQALRCRWKSCAQRGAKKRKISRIVCAEAYKCGVSLHAAGKGTSLKKQACRKNPSGTPAFFLPVWLCI